MDVRLQEMLDHYEITKTLRQYCTACDRCDEDRMVDVYMEDSWDDHGSFSAPGREFARATTARIHEVSESMFHMLGQTTVHVTGDVAGAETYFIAVSRVREDDRVFVNQLGGRFVDTLHREADKWRIKNRQVVRDWNISHPLEHEWATTAAMTPGARSDLDPAFAALGLVHGGPSAPQPD